MISINFTELEDLHDIKYKTKFKDPNIFATVQEGYISVGLSGKGIDTQSMVFFNDDGSIIVHSNQPVTVKEW